LSNGDATFDFFDDFRGTSLDTNKWTVNAVNTIVYSVNNYFRFEDASRANGIYWIYDGTDTGSQHQAKWIPTDSFIIEWESTMSDQWYGEIGQGGVAVVTTDNTIIYYVSFGDWCGWRLVPSIKVINESGVAYSNILSGSECVTNGYPGVWYSKFTIIRNGNYYEAKINETTVDTYFSSSPVSRIALAAGGYDGTYVYLDYIEVRNLKVRKYTSPEPVANVGNEENITNITISLLSSGNPSASLGNQFTSIIYLTNGTIIQKDFSLENNCNLGKDCILGKSTISLNSNVAIDKIRVCSKACSLICNEIKVS
jgi:hypothetical protein